jgi:hypothetical protein
LSIIVLALATGAAAGLKPTAEDAVKVAYGGLKALIKSKYQRVSIDMLENDPSDKMRQEVLEADLKKTDAATDPDVLSRANAVLAAVHDKAPETATALGVDLENIKAASLTLEHIMAEGAGATGVRAHDVATIGDVKISDVSVRDEDAYPKG